MSKNQLVERGCEERLCAGVHSGTQWYLRRLCVGSRDASIMMRAMSDHVFSPRAGVNSDRVHASDDDRMGTWFQPNRHGPKVCAINPGGS